MTNEENKTIRVVVCRPGERAEAEEIEDSLEAMQEIVGGLIQEYFPFHSESDPRYDDVVLIVNDEGRLLGLPLSREIVEDVSGNQNVIAGSFFICYGPVESERFLSLPEDLEEEFRKKYELPEVFFRTESGITAVKYEPDTRMADRDRSR